MQKSTWQVVPPNAAAVWPDSTSSIVDRAAERHVEVGVRVDARPGARTCRVASIDAVGLDVERLADQRDPLAVDEDVGDVVVRRGDDAAALDQNRHGSSFRSTVQD